MSISGLCLQRAWPAVTICETLVLKEKRLQCVYAREREPVRENMRPRLQKLCDSSNLFGEASSELQTSL